MANTSTDDKKAALVLHSVPQTAEILGLSKRSAWRLVARGEIATVRVGERLRKISNRAIEAYIKRNTVPEQ